MAATNIRGRQIQDGTVTRDDLNISTSGQGVIRRLLEAINTGILINASTGTDTGTGDVSLKIDPTYLDTLYSVVSHNHSLGSLTNTSTALNVTGSLNIGDLIYWSGTVWTVAPNNSVTASKLVGTDITTIGTVTTGTWNATKISEVYGGTNQNSYTTGDILYASATNTLSKLAGNTTTTKKFLSQTGNGSAVTSTVWSTLSYTDISGMTSHAIPFSDTSGFLTQNASLFIFDPATNFLSVGHNQAIATIHIPSDQTIETGMLSSPYFSFGVYHNYLTRSEAFNNATWVKTNIGTVTADSATAPYGGSVAEAVPAGSNSTAALSQVVTDTQTGFWTFSVWVKAASGSFSISLQIDSNAQTGTPKSFTIDSTKWHRIAVTQDLSTAHANKTVKIISGTNAYNVWGAQLEKNGWARPYGGSTGASNQPTDTVTAFCANFSVLQSLSVGGSIANATWAGVAIGIGFGGTGQTTANASLNALLPSQTGNGGKVLQTDGTNTSWATAGSGGGGVSRIWSFFIGS